MCGDSGNSPQCLAAVIERSSPARRLHWDDWAGKIPECTDYRAKRSVVSVADDPAVVLDTASGLGLLHTLAEVDLSQLVVRHDNDEVGEGWDSEVRERDLAGSEHDVDEWHVGEDGNEGSLEEETEVGVLVDHALLGKGEVSGLTDEQVSPLHADDGHEVSALGVPETFDGVADLSAVHVRRGVEAHELVWGPSALGPGFWGHVEVEQTQVEHVVGVAVPVELDDFSWPHTFYPGEFSFVSDQVLACSLIRCRRQIHKFGSTLYVGVASESSEIGRVVDIRVCGDNTWLSL
jgi:hypothetical protein